MFDEYEYWWIRRLVLWTMGSGSIFLSWLLLSRSIQLRGMVVPVLMTVFTIGFVLIVRKVWFPRQTPTVFR